MNPTSTPCTVNGASSRSAGSGSARSTDQSSAARRFPISLALLRSDLPKFAAFLAPFPAALAPIPIRHQVGDDQGREEEEKAKDEEQQPAVPFPAGHTGRPEGEREQNDQPDDSEANPEACRQRKHPALLKLTDK
jgi:hypothetical protein